MNSNQASNTPTILKSNYSTNRFYLKKYNGFIQNIIHPIIQALMKHINPLINFILNNIYESTKLDDYELLLFFVKNYNATFFLEFITNFIFLNSLSNDEIQNIIKVCANLGHRRLLELIFSLIFNSYNKQLSLNPLSVINFEDSVSFGSLSILKIYVSLNINNFNFKDSLAIAIIREYSDIIEYSLMYPFFQQYHFLSEDIIDLLKLTIYKKKTDYFNYFIERLGNQIIVDWYSKEPEDSLLNFACTFGNVKAAKIIIDLIIKSSPKTNCTTPFLNAAIRGYEEICQYMIDKNVVLLFYNEI